MPALQRVKRQARVVAYQSNLHQWGLCFTMYMNDNDGLFSDYYQNRAGFWQRVLRPYYVDVGELRCCPEATKPRVPSGGGGGASGSTFIAWGVFSSSALSWAEDGDYGSYGVNGWIYSKGSPHAQPLENYWKGYNVPGASNVPLLLDCLWIDGWPNPNNGPPALGDGLTYSNNFMARFCINRHNGFVNGTFMDSSVRKIGLKELWTLKWHRSFDTTGTWTTAGGVQPSDWPDWMRSFKDN